MGASGWHSSLPDHAVRRSVEEWQRMIRLLFYFFAVGEAITGFCLLVLPGVAFAWLFALAQSAGETLLVGRIAGAALLGFSIGCWPINRKKEEAAMRAELVGITTYNGTTSALLAYAGTALNMSGILLWPAVMFHAVLFVWGLAGLRERQRDSR